MNWLRKVWRVLLYKQNRSMWGAGDTRVDPEPHPYDLRWTGLRVEHIFTFRIGTVGADFGDRLTIIWDADVKNMLPSRMSSPGAHVKNEFKILPAHRVQI